MYKPHILGKTGEDIAVEYLIEKNYKIIERNFYCKNGEIDIIALKDNYLIFIEVKTRSSTEYGLPSEAVTKKKLESLYKTAKYYVYTRNLQDEFIRFDVIEVYCKNSKYEVNHILQVI